MLHMTKILSPPKLPRVSVPVTAELLSTFQRLGKAYNQSPARAMADWLQDTAEAAELMASTMERARAAPKIVTAELHAMILGMADQSKELADKYRKFRGPLAGTTERAAGPPGGQAKGIPPPCNTGGKVPEQGKPKRQGKSS